MKKEAGLTLLEVLVSVVIVGVVFIMISLFIKQNEQMIELTNRKVEARHVREDIKEWLGYRSQTQDIANLNSYVTADMPGEQLSEKEQTRRRFLILDNSGIQYDQNKPIYGEQAMEEELIVGDEAEELIPRGELIRKVVYWSNKPEEAELPNTLDSEENQLYMGSYRSSEDGEYEYLVLCEVIGEKTNNQHKTLEIELSVYDKETGKSLTSTIFGWVTDY